MKINNSIENKLFLRRAYKLAASFSDDPRTQNGAILVNNNDIIGTGANCLPRNIKKLPERLARPLKYSWICHAERNSIFSAAMSGFKTKGATLFCPWFACCDCANAIVQSGIHKIVGHKQVFEQYGEGIWTDSINIGNQMFLEAGIDTEFYDGEIGEVQILLNGKIWNP